MAKDFEVSAVIPASPQDVYDAWLTSDAHTRMTGGAARVSSEVGGTFEAWDGYIEGKNLELGPGLRIVQAWRTTQFESKEPDSQIEVLFEPEGEGTLVKLRHTKLPAHGATYEQGWIDHYFEPMKRYFGS